MGADIFINYRGLDAEYVPHLLSQRLSSEFGKDRVFLDIESIRPGDDYVQRLLAGVRSSKVLLAVIGPRWFAEDGDGKRLIDNPNDWIRRELVTAFACEVTVIPVFTEGATPPRPDDLPDDIAQLGRQHGLSLRRIRSGDDLDTIVREVSTHIEADVGADVPVPTPTRRPWFLLGIPVVVAIVAAALWLSHDDPDPGPPTTSPMPQPTTTTATTTPPPTTTTTSSSPPPVAEPAVWWEGRLTLNGEAFQTGYTLDTSPPERYPAGDLGLSCQLDCAANEIQGTAFVPWTSAGLPTRKQCVDLLNSNVGQRTLSVKAGTKACLGTVEMRVGYLDVVAIDGPGQMTIDVKVWDKVTTG